MYAVQQTLAGYLHRSEPIRKGVNLSENAELELLGFLHVSYLLYFPIFV